MVKNRKQSVWFKKPHRQQRDQGLKWEQLGVMCGIVDSTYTIRASSNIINFKFRPLPSNHQFFTRNMITRENMGFKIFVQAIPPVPPSSPIPQTGGQDSSNFDAKGASTHLPTAELELLKTSTHSEINRTGSTISSKIIKFSILFNLSVDLYIIFTFLSFSLAIDFDCNCYRCHSVCCFGSIFVHIFYKEVSFLMN